MNTRYRSLAVAAAFALALAFPFTAMAQTCPIEPDCIDLAPGEVATLPAYAGQTLCVVGQMTAANYTLVPFNPSTTSAMPVGLTVSSATAGSVASPAEPKTAEAMALAPLQDADHTLTAPTEAVADDVAPLLAPGRRAASLLPARPKVGGGVPSVGDLLQIQVEPGCTGTLDMRTGRVEAISTPAGSKMYMVQEVVEASPGVWEPSVPGGFSPAAFAALADAFVLPPPGTLTAPLGSGTGSVQRTGARDLLESNFGPHLDLDGNGGVVVFFNSRINAATPPATPRTVLARFEARDLLDASECPRSNEGEIIYSLMPDPTGQVNSNVVTQSFAFGQATQALVHQMVRLINAQRRLHVNSAPELEQPWLDESLAWVAEELVFYNVSAGLQPMSNIALADLTTGPNASTRVAAFNAWQNRQYGSMRTYLLASSSPTQGTFGAFQSNPPPLAGELPNERIANYYGATAAFLRYAMDRHPDTDAELLQALVDSQLTGIENLESVFGPDVRQWLHDFGVALAADDTALVVSGEYRTRSWNFRSIYGGLGGFPLVTFPFTDGVIQNIALGAGGGQRWHTFGTSAGGPAAELQIDMGAAAPMTPLRVSIVRTQ